MLRFRGILTRNVSLIESSVALVEFILIFLPILLFFSVFFATTKKMVYESNSFDFAGSIANDAQINFENRKINERPSLKDCYLFKIEVVEEKKTGSYISIEVTVLCVPKKNCLSLEEIKYYFDQLYEIVIDGYEMGRSDVKFQSMDTEEEMINLMISEEKNNSNCRNNKIMMGIVIDEWSNTKFVYRLRSYEHIRNDHSKKYSKKHARINRSKKYWKQLRIFDPSRTHSEYEAELWFDYVISFMTLLNAHLSHQLQQQSKYFSVAREEIPEKTLAKSAEVFADLTNSVLCVALFPVFLSMILWIVSNLNEHQFHRLSGVCGARRWAASVLYSLVYLIFPCTVVYAGLWLVLESVPLYSLPLLCLFILFIVGLAHVVASFTNSVMSAIFAALIVWTMLHVHLMIAPIAFSNYWHTLNFFACQREILRKIMEDIEYSGYKYKLAVEEGIVREGLQVIELLIIGATEAVLLFALSFLSHFLREFLDQIGFWSISKRPKNPPDIASTTDLELMENLDICFTVNNLTVRRGQQEVLLIENLELYRNKITAIMGENGSGKSSFLEALRGFPGAKKDTCFYLNSSVEKSSNLMMKQVGYCPKEDILYPKLTVLEHLKLHSQLKSTNFVKGDVEAWAQLLNFDQFSSKAGNLSTSEKRKTLLMMALVGHPETLLLDQPTRGMDKDSQEGIWEILSTWQGTVIFTTHCAIEAENRASRIVFLKDGNVRCAGSPEYLRNKFSTTRIISIESDDKRKLKIFKRLKFPCVLTEKMAMLEVAKGEEERMKKLIQEVDGVKIVSTRSGSMENAWITILSSEKTDTERAVKAGTATPAVPKEEPRTQVAKKMQSSLKIVAMGGGSTCGKQTTGTVGDVQKDSDTDGKADTGGDPEAVEEESQNGNRTGAGGETPPTGEKSLPTPALQMNPSIRRQMMTVAKKRVSASIRIQSILLNVLFLIVPPILIALTTIRFEKEPYGEVKEMIQFSYEPLDYLPDTNPIPVRYDPRLALSFPSQIMAINAHISKYDIECKFHPLNATIPDDPVDEKWKQVEAVEDVDPLLKILPAILAFFASIMAYYHLNEKDKWFLLVQNGMPVWLQATVTFFIEWFLFWIRILPIVASFFALRQETITGDVLSIILPFLPFSFSAVLVGYLMTLLVHNPSFGIVVAFVFHFVSGHAGLLLASFSQIPPVFGIVFPLFSVMKLMKLAATNQKNVRICAISKTDIPSLCQNVTIMENPVILTDMILEFVCLCCSIIFYVLVILIVNLSMRYVQKRKIDSKADTTEEDVNQLLVVKDLRKRYQDRSEDVVDSVKFTVNTSTALNGFNSSGKTSILKMISGETWTSSGKVLICGVPHQNEKAWRFFNYCPSHNNCLDERLTGINTLAMIANLRGFPPLEMAQLSANLIKSLGMEGWINRKVRTYSYGQKRRLVVAMSLIGSPNVLLMDSPTDGLDIFGRNLVMDVIKETISKDSAVLLATHDEKVTEQCDVIVFMRSGVIMFMKAREQTVEQNVPKKKTGANV